MNDTIGKTGGTTPIKRFFINYLNLKEDRVNELSVIQAIQEGIEFKGVKLLILIFAIFIASIGLHINSIAIIIGAMLISPLLGPVMGVGFSAAINDIDLLKHSFKSYLLISVFCVLTSTVYFVFTPWTQVQSELLIRTSPSIYDIIIALLGGLVAIFALLFKTNVNVIPGVAVATALIPPLCTAGFGLAIGNLVYFLGAFYLYFINSVFISIATFVAIKVMNFKQKESENKNYRRKVRRYIILILAFTLLPVIYLTINIVKNTIYENAANEFINNELVFENTQVLDRKIDYIEKEIKVVLIGVEVPEISLQSAKEQLVDYNLNNTTLTVIQGIHHGEEMDISSIKTLIMEDLYKKSEEHLQEQQNRISSLETDLKKYKDYNNLTLELIPEIKTLYPFVKSLSLSYVAEANFSSMKIDHISMAVIDVNRKLSEQEEQQMTEWLKVRMNADKLKLIIE